MNTRKAAWSLLLGGILSCGSSNHTPTRPLDSLDVSGDGAFVAQIVGSCGTILAVDATGQGWYNHGCEGSSMDLQPSSKLSHDQYISLGVSFATLPSSSDPHCTARTSPIDATGAYLQLTHQTAHSVQTWIACTDASMTVVAPYADAWSVLRTLTPK